MSALGLNEFHAFEASGHRFLYLVPSAAVFALDSISSAVLDTLEERSMSRGEIVATLADRFPAGDVLNSIGELRGVRAIGDIAEPQQIPPNLLPPEGFPLSTLVLNVTNKCNLSCTYCYEYGEDKIVDTENGSQPKFMTEKTARDGVELALRESGALPVAHVTFFGGETLLNFPVLQKTVAYARRRAAELNKKIAFSLTTNATLLRPDIIEWIAENDIGVTVSIDGPKEMQDEFRVFKGGAGSYDVVLPKIRELLRRHTKRPIGARVTLTRQTLDVERIFRHLTEEIGFWEVGFAPVTTAEGRDYAIVGEGFDNLLGQFRELAEDFLKHSIENRHHGFSNVKETLEEIHKGVSKAYPCGAGLGLMGVATDGEVALCHRFAGSEEHSLGNVAGGVGIDRERQAEFFERHHINHKTDCSICWARPLCSGGCYHEAHTRYGDTGAANLHYCEWIRGWTDTCLQIYGELAVHNPRFLSHFDGEEAA